MNWLQNLEGEWAQYLDEDRSEYWINIRDLGAQGNGVHDDSDALISAIAAVRAPETVPNVGSPEGGTVFIPRGRWRIRPGIALFPGVNLVGAGAGATELFIDASPNPATDALTWQNDVVGSTSGLFVHVRDLQVVATSGACRDALSFLGMQDFQVERVVIGGTPGRHGLYANNAQRLSVSGCHLRGAAAAGMFLDGATISARIAACLFEANTAAGIHLANASGAVFVGCKVSNNGGYGALADKGNFGFDNCWFENNVLHDMSFGAFDYVTFSAMNCVCKTGASKTAGNGGLWANNALGGIIGGGDYSSVPTSITLGSACKGVSVVGPYTGTVEPTYNGAPLWRLPGIAHYNQATSGIGLPFNLMNAPRGSVNATIGTIHPLPTTPNWVQLTLSAPGARAGDVCVASMNPPAAGITLNAMVNADDSIVVYVTNASAIDLTIGTVQVNAFAIR